ncbi:MAG: serine/threonine-protein kinase [Anaerolineaceae bacterium]|nr:serine/threonine-protein kinase [Anaerolineaceae bacterium]
MTLDPGFLLHNRYRVSEVITRGGMGAIYCAYDESLNITVAIKENFYTTNEYSRQFKREATMLASLRHPNLPRVTDHFVLSGEGQYLVMDFIEGEDLKEHIEKTGVLQEDDIIIIGAAISDALHYLHTREPAIVHRDVKPGNIKITPNGQVFLVDFGLAKRIEGGQMTTVGAQALTPGFAPPEQYGGGTEPASDIYSLGATLYVAATNSIPVDSLERALGGPQLVPVRKLNPKINEKLAATIEKAMNVEVRDRYHTDLEFRHALIAARHIGAKQNAKTSEFLAGSVHLLEENRRPTRGSAQQRQTHFKTSPGLLAMGGLAVLIVLGVLYQFVARPLINGSSVTEGTLSPDQTALVSMDPTEDEATQTTLEPTPVELVMPTSIPIGGGNGQIAFASARNAGIPQIFLINTNGTNVIQLTNQVDGACQPAWAPDGKRFAFISPCTKIMDEYRGSSLFIMNVDGSGLQPISTTPDGDYDPAWSPDGTKLAFTSLRDGRSHVYIYDFETGVSLLLSPESAYDSNPIWSPDSFKLAFEGKRSGLSRVWTINADGTDSRALTREEVGNVFIPAWSPDGEVVLYILGLNPPKLFGQRYNDNLRNFAVGANEFPIYRASYSPDGMYLAIEGKQDGSDRDIFLMTRNGTNLFRLTNDPSDDFGPAWRPLSN